MQRKEILILVGASLASFGAGGGLTYLIVDKRLKTKYEQIAEQEIAEAKEYYAKTYKVEEYATPEQVAEKYNVEVNVQDDQEVLVEKMETIVRQYHTGVSMEIGETDGPFETEEELEVTEPDPEATTNIFDNPITDIFDYEAELRNREDNPGDPYVISFDEFYQNESNYTQQRLAYFEGDDVLVDEQDMIVTDSNLYVGDDNLTKFGHGSKDKNTVYIRNETLDLDFEVVRSGRTYAEEVHGFTDEGGSLKHSDSAVRKFRRSHDG